MKEKILSKEEVSLSQETICQNINNLSATLVNLLDIDAVVLGEELEQKLTETKENLINAIHYYSTYIQEKD